MLISDIELLVRREWTRASRDFGGGHDAGTVLPAQVVAQSGPFWGLPPEAGQQLPRIDPFDGIPGTSAGQVVDWTSPTLPPFAIVGQCPEFWGVEPHPLGAHLKSPRNGYFHHGIYIGGSQVVHFAGDQAKDLATASVRIGNLDEFADGHPVQVVAYRVATLDPQQTINNALSLVGRGGYNLLTSNCEHAARWCVTGRWESVQVQTGAVSIGALVLLGLLFI